MALDSPPDKPIRRRKKPEDRRHDLLEAAVACLAEFGPRATTGREVCRKAGVSHGLLQHYFGAPEDLFLETYEALSRRYLDNVERILAPAGDPAVSMRTVFEELFSEDWGSTNIFGAWIAFWFMISTDERFARVHERDKNRQRDLLGAIFRRRASGEDPVEAATLMSAVMDGVWLEFCLAPGALSARRAVELCSQAFERFSGPGAA